MLAGRSFRVQAVADIEVCDLSKEQACLHKQDERVSVLSRMPDEEIWVLDMLRVTGYLELCGPRTI